MVAALELAAKSGEAAKAGPIGLVVILLLIIVCYFLFKSMSRHLRKVREGFPLDDAPRPDAQQRVQQPADPAPTPPEADPGPPGSER